MVKDASLFSSLDTAEEKKIYMEDEFTLDTASHGDVASWCGQIVDVFHVPSLSVNMLSVSLLTQTSNIVE